MTPCLDTLRKRPAAVPPMQRLMVHVVDYAGLYPPAALNMTSAVHNYATYRAGDNAWALGHFVLNAARLEEFESEMRELLEGLRETDPWELSALCGPSLDEDFAAVRDFNARHKTMRISSVELKTTSAQEIAGLASRVPEGLRTYFEMPLSADPVPYVRAIAAANARAKIRTGGPTATMFPSTADLCAFLTTCCRHSVAFKATAGLHHPFCGSYRLSYEKEDERTALMHGFLNVFLGAIFLWAGIRPELLPELLTESKLDAFGFDERGVSWRHHWASNEQIDEARASFAVAFGSCSFDEPLRALRHLKLLP